MQSHLSLHCPAAPREALPGSAAESASRAQPAAAAAPPRPARARAAPKPSAEAKRQAKRQPGRTRKSWAKKKSEQVESRAREIGLGTPRVRHCAAARGFGQPGSSLDGDVSATLARGAAAAPRWGLRGSSAWRGRGARRGSPDSQSCTHGPIRQDLGVATRVQPPSSPPFRRSATPTPTSGTTSARYNQWWYQPR